MDKEKLREIVGELAGSASMCWTPRPEGVFNPTEAQKFVDQAISSILELEGKEQDEGYAHDKLFEKIGEINELRKEIAELKKHFKDKAITAPEDVHKYIREVEQDRDRLQSIVREQKEVLEKIAKNFDITKGRINPNNVSLENMTDLTHVIRDIVGIARTCLDQLEGKEARNE